jgi:hypothetical protein
MRNRALALAALPAVVASCATVWGFQAGTLESPDAGTDGGGLDTTPDGGSDAPLHRDAVGYDAGARDAPVADVRTERVRGMEASTAACASPNACAPQLPDSGWSGPYVISETSGTPSALPVCGSSYPKEAYTGLASLDAGPASCTCRCEAAEGGACLPPTVTLYRNPTCMDSNLCATVDASLGACVTFDPSCSGAHMTLTESRAVAGSCSVVASTALPDAAWGAAARLCAPDETATGTCANAGVCMPPVPGLPFQAVYCIASPSLNPVQCPPGPYSHQRVYYMGLGDTRGCTACACSPPSVVCSGGTISNYSSPGCNGQASGPSPTIPESCTNVGASKSGRYNDDAILNSGPCEASGGVNTGNIAPTMPTTICCTE